MDADRLVGLAVLHIGHKARQIEVADRAVRMEAQNFQRYIWHRQAKTGQILFAERTGQGLRVVEDRDSSFEQVGVVEPVALNGLRADERQYLITPPHRRRLVRKIEDGADAD